MRVLLDNNVNHRFGALLREHEVVYARTMGWAELANGTLIAAAEAAGFDVMVTADKNMRYQQNLLGRRIGIVVLNCLFLKLPSIATLAPQVQALLDGGLAPSAFFVVDPPI